MAENPWIGLNSYAEGQAIYGRDEEIEVLSSRIQYNVQTVVYGRSGIGKSSILCAGIFPRLRENNILPIRIRLEHNDKPYIEQIKECLYQELDNVECNANELVKRHTDQDGHFLFSESLWEFFHRYEFKNQEGILISPLIVLDQFEEIFTLEKDRKKVDDFFVQLADLLNDTKPAYLSEYEEKLYIESGEDDDEETSRQNKSKISALLKKKSRHRAKLNYLEEDNFHIVLTIREDYLSYLERNTIHIPSLKHNRYCLQPINEEQAAKIITQPCPGLVETDTAKLIIEKVTGETDFKLDGIPEILVDSAVLSLYLSRLFEKKGDEKQITPSLIEKFGNNIIEDFYNETISNYPTSVIEFLEDSLLNDEGHRENISVYKALHGCKDLTQEMLNDLANVNKLIRCFSYNDSTRIEFIHDILCPVIFERKNRREQFRLQEEEARRQEEEKQKAIAEEKRKRKEIEEKAKLDKIRNRKRTFWLVACIIFLFGIGWAYYYGFQHVFSAYYSSYEIKKGHPVGIGKLSEEERTHTALYYKLDHVGFRNKDVITQIEVMSSNKFLPNSPHVKVYGIGECEDYNNKKKKEFETMLSSVNKIMFTRDNQDRASKEEYFNENGEVVFLLNYFYTNDNEAWIHFVSGNGQSLQVSDEGAEQIKVSWDDEDRLLGEMFYDHDGVCVSIDTDINGYLWDYSQPNTTCEYILNEYNQPTNKSYNTIYTYTSNDSIVVTYAKSLNINDNVSAFISHNALGPSGYHKYVTADDITTLYSLNNAKAEQNVQYDKKGNILSLSIIGSVNEEHPLAMKYKYNDDGLLIKKEVLGLNNRPFSTRNDGIYKWEWNYDDKGVLTYESRVNTNNEIVYSYSIVENDGQTIREYIDISKQPSYCKRIDSENDSCRTSEFYNIDNEPLNGKWLVGETDSAQYFHKMVVTNHDNTTTISFYYYDGMKNKNLPLETRTDEWGQITSFYKKILVKNEKNEVEKYQIYDKNNKLRKSMMYFYINGEKIGRAVCGIDGTPVRCPNWEEEGYTYYKMYFTRIKNDRYKTIQAVNEWEDVCYFYDGEKYSNTSYINYKGAKTNNGYLIQNDYKQIVLVDAQNITDEHIPYLHILSKSNALYKLGLRDGDRIVQFGSWKRGMPEIILAKEWNQSVINNLKINVLRPQDDKKYESIEVQLQSCKNLNESAEYHWLALTEEELKIINY